MDKESAEKNAKLLVESIEAELKNFLQKNPIEKLETIQQRFIQGKNPLNLLLCDLIEDLKKYEFLEGWPYERQFIDKRIWAEIRDFQKYYFETFLYYNVMLTFLNSPYSPLIESHRKELRNKHKLTSKKIKQELLKILGSSFPEEIRHSNKEVFWNDNNKLEFLALYNRFHIVIKNARRDFRSLIKKRESELDSERKILAKYEIPQTKISLALYSDSAPEELALDWAKEKMELRFEEDYLKKILTNARQIWRSRIKKGLIIENSTEENPKIQFILIDINFQIGCRYYAVKSIDKNKMDKLKYTTVAKQFTDSPAEFSNIEEFKGFLIAMVFQNRGNTLNTFLKKTTS